MNKKLLLAGTSALAMTVASAALADDSGAWATINDGDFTVGGNTAAPDNGQVRPNDITDSFIGASGVMHVQQNEGSANSINAAGAVHASINQGAPSTSGAVVYGRVIENEASQNAGERTNDVTDSFTDASGIMTVQQNNGDHNEIGSAEAVQYDQAGNGDVGTVAVVHSETVGNFSDQRGGLRNNEILGGFNGASGVMTVQQNNGDHNAIGSAVAVYGANGAPDSYGNVEQEVDVFGVTADQQGSNDTVSSGSSGGQLSNQDNIRHNIIDPSFQNAQGIATVQQNNGNANAISAATSVVANVGGAEDLRDDTNVAADNDLQNVSVDGEVWAADDVVNNVRPSGNWALDRDNNIADQSFDGFQGIATVQQNNGDVNVLGVGTAVGFNDGLSGYQMQNDVDQVVEVESLVFDPNSFDDDTGGITENDVTFVQGDRNNNIADSFNNGAAGIVSVQQNNGSQNVMGIGNGVHANRGTTAETLDGTDDVGFQGAFALADIDTGYAEQTAGGVGGGIDVTHRSNDIGNSFVGFEGVATIQQNNGDNNAMSVANAIAASIDSTDKFDDVGTIEGSVAETEAYVNLSTATELDDDDVQNDSGANRLNSINAGTGVGAFNGAAGVITVQQNNGSNNAMAAANTVTANIGTAVDQDDLAGAVNNSAIGLGESEGNSATNHPNSDRVNEIPGSFVGAQGIMTVQQNNGDNNVMGASTAVAADIDTEGAPLSGFGPAASTASLNATVSGNTTVAYAPSGLPGLSNTINSGAFNNARGIMTVQQNNGSNNVIQSAIAVSANLVTPN